MTEQSDYDIALARIAAEAAAKTGTLDLQNLHLAALPPEIARLGHLRALIFGGSPWLPPGSEISVTDLTPLSGLTGLQTLDCSSTAVTDLTPLSGLTGLQVLDCSSTAVTDLTPLSGLSGLHTLYCTGTGVTDLSPLSGLSGLQTLFCNGMGVTDLTPLSGLTGLQTLYCTGTGVTDLSPLAGLPALVIVNAWGITLATLPRDLVWRETLRYLIVSKNHVPGIPNGILSTFDGDNCLERLRAHLADLEREPVATGDVKLFLLGNGRVGKTQIARRLRGEPFVDRWDSTHGIHIDGEPRPNSIAERLHLKLWDFGGQDIYHGTHALFLGAPAIVVVAWAPAFDNRDLYVHDGLTFCNHPLAYWLALVRQHGGPHAPVLVVQTRCESKDDEARRLPVEASTIEAFAYCDDTLRVDSRTGRGFDHLEATLADAVTWMQAPGRLGTAMIGAGRLRVQRRLEAMRAEDAARPPAERRHRLLDRASFDRICAADGGVADSDALLHYLDANDVVLWRPYFLPDRIVLDQAWVLEAIYTVLDRDNVLKIVRSHGGRFSRDELALLVWGDYAPEERDLFLSVMRASGICFLHRRFADPGLDDGASEYIAPDCLPEYDAVASDLAARWDDERAHEEAVFRHPLLHGGLIRSIVAEIGETAGVDALYWRGGVCGFDRAHGSRFVVEEVTTGEWSGEIRIRTQKGDAATMLDTLVRHVERIQSRWSMQPSEATRSSAPASGALAPPPPISPAQEKPPMTEWYVSYAWGDHETPEGIAREKIVDDLCEAAAASGRTILRDKNEIGLGESISAFMRRLGAGDRIFVVLSDKYLRSPACMFELSEVWRQSRQEGRAFLDRVRVYTVEGTRIWGPTDPIDWAIHWKTERDAFEQRAAQHGAAILGEAGQRRLLRMQRFAYEVADILSILTDIRQPRSFEDLKTYGFDDPPAA